MSNPWAQSFEDLRSPYLQEKKAKKDYDGDGKIESGAKEYRGVVHNKIQKAKGGKADGQDTSSVKEHHQKDADGNPIEHGDGTPASLDELSNRTMRNYIIGGTQDLMKKSSDPESHSGTKYAKKMNRRDGISRAGDKLARRADKKEKKEEISYTAAYLQKKNVDEAKVDQGMSTDQKRAARNERSGRKDKAEIGPATGKVLSKSHMSKFNQSMRRDDHEGKRGVKKEKGKMTLKDRAGKMRGMTKDNRLKNIMSKSTSVKKDGNNMRFSHYEPDGELVNEADKKGKGSGTKDACYHKVKSRYSVWPSAYASGALVKCRKAGAKNWGNSSKKEEFDYYQMPMKSFDDMVGECWKTHKKVGMKMKGGKMVPDCRPKNEEIERIDEIDIKNLKVKAGEFINNLKTKYKNFRDSGQGKEFDKGVKTHMRLNMNSYNPEGEMIEAVKTPRLDVKETGVKNKIEINPEIKTEAAKAPVKK